tara:strand:- start:1364 stop:1516 length:153 start_codon:yes stop_codon:yes gene_type:complete
MDTKFNGCLKDFEYMIKKKNLIAKNLLSPRYKAKIVKPKKGKGSFKRKKN